MIKYRAREVRPNCWKIEIFDEVWFLSEKHPDFKKQESCEKVIKYIIRNFGGKMLPAEVLVA